MKCHGVGAAPASATDSFSRFAAKTPQGHKALLLLIKSAVIGMHSASKRQREAVRQLLHAVIIRDMSTFNPENFKSWIIQMDGQFRKCSLMIRFEIRQGVVYFTVKEVRSGRTLFHFGSSTRVRFDDSDVVVSFDAKDPIR